MKRIFLPFPLGSRQGTLPKLTAKSNCRFEIEWVTEYACHRDYLESQNCTLSSAQHDVAVNLQPLSRVGGERGALGAGMGPGPSAPCPGAGAASQTGGSGSPTPVHVVRPLLVCVPRPFLSLRLILHLGGGRVYILSEHLWRKPSVHL